MRKLLIFFLLFCAVFTTTNAATINSATFSEGSDVPIRSGDHDSGSNTRPRAPRRQMPFSICYVPSVHALVVTSSSDVNVVVAVIENLSTGAFYTYSFDSSEPAFLPINGESGLWRITLFLSRNDALTDYFQIV